MRVLVALLFVSGCASDALAADCTCPRTPHFVDVDTGVDRGPFAGWDRLWNEALGEYVGAQPIPLFFLRTDCTGEPFARFVTPEQSTLRFIPGPLRTYLSVGPKMPQPLSPQSVLVGIANGTQCMPTLDTGTFRTASDTGIPAILIDVERLRIDLR